MNEPAWSEQNNPPAPSSREPFRPFILHQDVLPDGAVRVTFALPGLMRAQIRVPWDSWIAGEHLRIMRALPSVMDEIRPDIDPDQTPDSLPRSERGSY